MSDAGTPWLTITKNPTVCSVSRSSAAVASSAPGTPAKHGPKSMTGIVVSDAPRDGTWVDMAMNVSPLRALVGWPRQHARRSHASRSARKRRFVQLDAEPGRGRHRDVPILHHEARPRDLTAARLEVHEVFRDQEVRDRGGDLKRRRETDGGAVVVVRRDRHE